MLSELIVLASRTFLRHNNPRLISKDELGCDFETKPFSWTYLPIQHSYLRNYKWILSSVRDNKNANIVTKHTCLLRTDLRLLVAIASKTNGSLMSLALHRNYMLVTDTWIYSWTNKEGNSMEIDWLMGLNVFVAVSLITMQHFPIVSYNWNCNKMLTLKIDSHWPFNIF